MREEKGRGKKERRGGKDQTKDCQKPQEIREEKKQKKKKKRERERGKRRMDETRQRERERARASERVSRFSATSVW